MGEAAAAVVVVVLGPLGVLQVLVASGAPLGRFVWGGGHDVLPARLRVGSAASVAAYAGMAVVVFDRGDGGAALLTGAVAAA